MAPDLHKLGHFVAVAEELNFTRAAERLNMAQQALSGSIRRLEQELGVTLFVRSTRHVELTVAGAALLAEGRGLLASSNAAWEEVRRVARTQVRSLRLGCTFSIPPDYIGQLVAGWRTTHPDVLLLASGHYADEVVAGVSTGRFDVGLCFLTEAPALEVTVLGALPLRLAVDARHPLAARPRIAMSHLSRERFVTWHRLGDAEYPDYRVNTDWLVALCRNAGFEPQLALTPVEGGPPEVAVAGTDLVALTLAPPGPALDGRAIVLHVEPPPMVPVRALTAHRSPPIGELLTDAAAALAAGVPFALNMWRAGGGEWGELRPLASPAEQ
jgi:DNA-binding transcriptional LysR family regulator